MSTNILLLICLFWNFIKWQVSSMYFYFTHLFPFGTPECIWHNILKGQKDKKNKDAEAIIINAVLFIPLLKLFQMWASVALSVDFCFLWHTSDIIFLVFFFFFVFLIVHFSIFLLFDTIICSKLILCPLPLPRKIHFSKDTGSLYWK